MRLRRLFEDDDAVAPAIAVVLLIAIAVVLAVVVATFALNVGETDEEQPSASFTIQPDAPDSTELTITHERGDSIEAQQLFVRGDNLDSTGAWSDIDSSQYDPQDDISATDSLSVTATDTDYRVVVVWQSLTTDDSATLASREGPDR